MQKKISFFSMAALQGDIQTVNKCLKAGWPILCHKQLTESSPLIQALYGGRRAVVQLMISWSHFPINKKRKSDGATFLHLACKYGGPDMVGDLLKINGIRINAQDKKGKIPLMNVCKASIFSMEKRLFEQLFFVGASLTIKDREGLTALDHAVRHNHPFAVKMLQNETSRRLSSASKVMNLPSKKAANKAAFFTTKAHKVISDDDDSLCLVHGFE